jgi:hypothetical protein
VSTPAEEINPSFPMTLDLRWPAPGQTIAMPEAAAEFNA